MYHKTYLIVFWSLFLTFFLSHALNDSGHPHKKSCTDTITSTTSLPTATTTSDLWPTSFPNTSKGSNDCYCIQNGKRCECKLPPKYEPPVIVAASLLISFGSVMVLGGFMLFRVTIILTGFVIGCIVAWIGLQINEPFDSYPNGSALYLGVCISVGAVVGLLFMVFYQIGMYALMMLAGGLLTIFICQWREDFVIQNFVHRSIVALVLMAVFVLGLVFTEYVAVVLSTSFIGSYMVIHGADFLIQTGLLTGLETLLDFNAKRNSASPYHLNQFLTKRFAPGQYNPDWKVQCMMGAVIGLCLVAVIFQGWFNKGNRFGLNVVRNTNDTIKDIK